MRRREFITLLGGAAASVTLPLAALAQQSVRMRRIGVLMSTGAQDAPAQARLAAFLQGLQEFGWAVGRNVRIDIRWPAADPERTRREAAELVGLAQEVIMATGSATVAPLQQLTRSVPIVFVIVPDPVGAGFVDNLARPAAMPPALRRSSSVWPANGWSYSSKSCRARHAQLSFATPDYPLGSGSSP